MSMKHFFALRATNSIPYCFVLLFVLLGLLPIACFLLKSNGISLKNEIFSKGHIGRDILYGATAAIVSALFSLLFSTVTNTFANNEHVSAEIGASTVVLQIVALVFVAGIVKEIIYRGFAKLFISDVLGEMPAFLLANILFAILDWHNLGKSFISGLIAMFLYKKTKHLLAPIIAHGGVNLITTLFVLFS